MYCQLMLIPLNLPLQLQIIHLRVWTEKSLFFKVVLTTKSNGSGPEGRSGFGNPARPPP